MNQISPLFACFRLYADRRGYEPMNDSIEKINIYIHIKLLSQWFN